MTREEAKIFLITISYKLGTMAVEYLTEKDGEKMREAIETLYQEPCEDAVSRQSVKEQMIYYGFLAPDMTVTEFVEDCLPSVNPQKSKTGHWEQYGNSWEDKFKCSECGKEQPKILCREQIIGHWSDYCPNCGAKMSEIPTGSERSE